MLPHKHDGGGRKATAGCVRSRRSRRRRRRRRRAGPQTMQRPMMIIGKSNADLRNSMTDLKNDTSFLRRRSYVVLGSKSGSRRCTGCRGASVFASRVCLVVVCAALALGLSRVCACTRVISHHNLAGDELSMNIWVICNLLSFGAGCREILPSRRLVVCVCVWCVGVCVSLCVGVPP